ncbi:MAG: EthD family reductase [Acetobacteraceae bacterium]|nr:EthD family reductase [Acetobacteraceae bacterium]
MVVVSVAYPASQGSRFDLEYYRAKHTALVRERWSGMGLSDVRLIRGTGGMGGGPLAFHMIALLYFRSQAELDEALKAHGREIMGDIPQFTDVQPQVQVNEELA